MPTTNNSQASLKGHPATGPTSRHPGGISVVDILSGTLISAPTYPIEVNAVFQNGCDYIKPDPSGAFLRLDVKSLLKDKSGAYITLYYTGHVETTEAILKALSGAPDAKTVDFGNICEYHTTPSRILFSNRSSNTSTSTFIYPTPRSSCLLCRPLHSSNTMTSNPRNL